MSGLGPTNRTGLLTGFVPESNSHRSRNRLSSFAKRAGGTIGLTGAIGGALICGAPVTVPALPCVLGSCWSYRLAKSGELDETCSNVAKRVFREPVNLFPAAFGICAGVLTGIYSWQPLCSLVYDSAVAEIAAITAGAVTGFGLFLWGAGHCLQTKVNRYEPPPLIY